MAPNVVKTKGRAAAAPQSQGDPEGRPDAEGRPAAGAVAVAESAKAAELRRLLRELRQHVEHHCDYVGERFAEAARTIHYGETDPRGLYGATWDAEAEPHADHDTARARVPWLPPANPRPL